MNKKVFLMMLALLMALSCAFAESAEITLNGETRTVTLENREFSDGVLTLTIGGMAKEDAAWSSILAAPAWMYILIDDVEIQAEKVASGTDGLYSYTFTCDREPDAIYIFPDGVEETPSLMWIDPAYEKLLEERAAATPEPQVLSVEVKMVEVTPTPEPTPSPAPTPAPVDKAADYADAITYLEAGNTLKDGSRGAPAKALQLLLIAHGESIDPDGIVGKLTMGALHRVEAACGLPETDWVDLDTFNLLLDNLK